MTATQDGRERAAEARAEQALRRWLDGDDSAIAEWLDAGAEPPRASQEPMERGRPTEGPVARHRELAERLSRRIVSEVMRALAEIDRPGPLDDARWFP